MQKVVYSVSKVNKDEKLKGVGYLIEGNLLIPATSQKGNLYIRMFEDVQKQCKPVPNTENEFKGYVTVAYENVHVYNKEKDHYDTLNYVETIYFVWFKLRFYLIPKDIYLVIIINPPYIIVNQSTYKILTSYCFCR